MLRKFSEQVDWMPSFAGIIYPNAFQMNDLIVSMSQTFLSLPASQPFRFFRYKNIEMGSWNVAMATNKRKTIWALITGEILNLEDIRRELLSQGIALEECEMAQIVIAAYERWGITTLLEKLNGPFAFALFDERNEELYLALDRMGQRALYWTFQGNCFLFSTEIKGLLASGIVPQTLSNSACSSFLYFGFMPQDFSPIEGVNKLLSGHYLKIDLKKQMAITQYWSFAQRLEKRAPCSLKEATAELGSLLEKSLRRALPTEERLSIHLKDTLGCDTLTWMLAHTKRREEIDTFTPIFEGERSSPLKHATQFAKELTLRHHTQQISVDAALDALPSVIWMLDEPIADPYILETWQLGRLVRPTRSALILDLGWQELMGGHAHYFERAEDHFPFSPPLAHTAAKLPFFLRDRLLFPLLKAFTPRFAFRILRNIEIDKNQIAYLSHSALFQGDNRKKASPFLYQYFDPEVFTQRFHRISHDRNSVNASLYYDLKTALPNHSLMQYNRLLTPLGVRILTPFLDNNIVDFSSLLPDDVKFADALPAAVLQQLWSRLTHGMPTQRETTPMLASSWKNHPRLRALFTHLRKGRLVEEGLISQRWVVEQCAPSELTDIAFRELWAVLTLEVWFHLYINRPIGMQDFEVKTEALLGSS